MPELFTPQLLQIIVHGAWLLVMLACGLIGVRHAHRTSSCFYAAQAATLILLLFHAMRLAESAPSAAENILLGMVLYLTGALLVREMTQSSNKKEKST